MGLEKLNDKGKEFELDVWILEHRLKKFEKLERWNADDADLVDFRGFFLMQSIKVFRKVRKVAMFNYVERSFSTQYRKIYVPMCLKNFML